ncbi:MAG TPA: TetR/AcrR family transcriptional regulator [Acidimicrobiia bacterium]|nr:TetR/AcrR family transcriptional regulator [Acidimicrobiia bacterium]
MTTTSTTDCIVPRRRSRRAETAILEATVALLGEVGFAGLTIDGIAARAGVGKATIYRHWASKAEVAVDAFTAFIPPLDDPDTGSFADDARAVLLQIVDGLTNSPLAGILPSLVDAAERDAELERLFTEFGRARRAVLRAVFDRAAARGELRPGLDIDVAIDALVGPIFTRRLITRAPVTREHAAAVLDLLLPVLQRG